MTMHFVYIKRICTVHSLARALTVLLVGLALAVGCSQNHESCPVCRMDATLVKISTLSEEHIITNLFIKDESICAPSALINDESVVCINCGYIHINPSMPWELGLEQNHGFARPLSVWIRDFPLPDASKMKSKTIYSQSISGTNITDSVAFWIAEDIKYEESIGSYSKQHDIDLDIKRYPNMSNQVYIAASFVSNPNPSKDNPKLENQDSDKDKDKAPTSNESE